MQSPAPAERPAPSPETSTLRLAELLGSLSLCTDIANGQAPEQCLRMALVASRLAAAGGLAPAVWPTVYWTALLRYLGCNGFAVEEAAFAAGDDIGLRASFVATDVGRPTEFLQAVLRDVGRGAALGARAAGIARLLTSPGAARAHALAQCDAAIALARKAGMDSEVAAALAQSDERYDGRGQPDGLRGDALTPAICHVEVARVAVVFHLRGGVPAARAEVLRRAGGHLDPALAHHFARLAEELCAGLDQSSVWPEFLAVEPGQRRIGRAQLAQLFEAFALFADMKSAHGLGHSTGVARLAGMAAQAQGLPAAQTQPLEHAALLHDLGRVSVPTGIWDKPGPLTPAEWERVRLHAYFTDRVLRSSPALAPLADIAGHAHERLDGAGYPRGDRAARLDRAMRLLAAADVYQACCQARAWRPAHGADQAAQALRGAVAQGLLCGQAVDAVLSVSGERQRQRAAPPRDALSEREIDVVRLLAAGQTNKQIARGLGISPRTVQHHTLHIYAKLGVQSRAGAALYAAEHGLVAGNR